MLLVVVQGDGRHEDAWLSCNVFLRAAAAAVAAASASSAAVASVFHQPTPAGIIHRALSTNVEAKAHASGRPRRRLRQTGSRAAGTHARACVTRADADTHTKPSRRYRGRRCCPDYRSSARIGPLAYLIRRMIRRRCTGNRSRACFGLHHVSETFHSTLRHTLRTLISAFCLSVRLYLRCFLSLLLSVTFGKLQLKCE